jgi:molybdopterin-guanine dinucleotide biosynthesis protein A
MLAHAQDGLMWTAADVTELDLAVAPKADQERPHPTPSYIPAAALPVDIQPYLMATSGRS